VLISILKSNKPIVLVYIPFIAIAMWVFAFIDPIVLVSEHTMPLYKLIVWLSAGSNIAAICFSIIILIIQSIILNSIIIKNRIFSKNNNLPALLYLVIMSCCPSLLTLHPVLFANLFLMFTINSILAIYREEDVFPQVFDAGFFVGIASLFYFPVIMLFPFILVGLLILRQFVWREWLISFTGLMIPYFFVNVYYFWFDKLNSFWYESVLYPIINRSYNIEVDQSFYLLISISLMVIFFSSRRLFLGLSINTIQAKKYLRVLIWFFIFSLLSMLIAPSYSIIYFMVMAIPLSIYSTNYFLLTKKKGLSEVVFLLFIVAIVYVQIVNLY